MPGRPLPPANPTFLEVVRCLPPVLILCFLIILTLLVVIHEAGHATVARLCGVRVTEFFVGMPWGPEVSWRSKRSGIKYGATFALVGGYTDSRHGPGFLTRSCRWRSPW